MGKAKDIIIKVIPSRIANGFIKKHHYSGKVVQNSILHFGAFLDGKLHGVLSYGSPLDKSKVLPLVQPSLWNEMLELNRMAFDEYLPKNSESRCIATSIRLIKKNAPQIKWILSFADACDCGDGTIYRASGFVLSAIKKNSRLFLMPDGRKEHIMNYEACRITPQYAREKKNVSESVNSFMNRIGAKPLVGHQLRYIYLIDKSCKITVPILPFSKIDELGAGMYKGEKRVLRD